MIRNEVIPGRFIEFKCRNAGIIMDEFNRLLDPDKCNLGANKALIRGSYLNIIWLIFRRSAN